MHRIACIRMPRWPLQLLRRAHPEWADFPVVVVAEEKTNAELLLLDERAEAHGLSDLMRLGAAQSLVPSLRAGVVERATIDAAIVEVLEALRRHSPRVEASDVGVFYADPSGLVSLYGSTITWAETVHAELTALGHRATIVVGFGRHRTRAIATDLREPVRVLDDEEQERALAASLPLDRFGISSSLRESLAILGIHTSGALARLPPLELAARFGSEALALYQAMHETLGEPLAPTSIREVVDETLELDPPDHDVERLLFLVKAMLDRLLRRLRERSEAATQLVLTLTLDHAPDHVESLEPSSPTSESTPLVELVRLRLSRASLVAPVTHLAIRLEGMRVHGLQLELLAESHKRDIVAAARAIARLHATFGPGCTSHPSPRDAHMPEARFSWARTNSVALPRALSDGELPLVRRVPREPHPLGTRLTALGIVALHGPYRIEGRWWSAPLSRDYYFAETADGSVLWLYRDALRKLWFSYGEVD